MTRDFDGNDTTRRETRIGSFEVLVNDAGQLALVAAAAGDTLEMFERNRERLRPVLEAALGAVIGGAA
jgi:hypothetical protein